MAESRPLTNKNEPKVSSFTQQELSSFRPLFTPKLVIGILCVLTVVFIPIGAACLAASLSVQEYSVRYDNYPECTNAGQTKKCSTLTSASDIFQCNNRQTNPVPLTCTVKLHVEKDMKGPVYVYYQLTNFYQNHRRYVKSRSDYQLRGLDDSASGLSYCNPELTASWNTNSSSNIISPCGLIAWSTFNDTIALTKSPKLMSTSGITWSTDFKSKFANISTTNFNDNGPTRGGAIIKSMQDERLIVWMRTAALPNFRKLYGVFDKDISGDVVFNVTNRYNTYQFGGTKSIVLSTTSWLGGKNLFLGVTFIVIGGLCFLLALVFIVSHIYTPRVLGDTTKLSFLHS